MSAFNDLHKRAVQAYLAVIREEPTGWTPPPSFETRDKHWSRRLREAWPDSATVTLEVNRSTKDRYSEMREWCNTHGGSYWCNGTGNVWYFEQRSLAVLFKLTHGGIQND